MSLNNFVAYAVGMGLPFTPQLLIFFNCDNDSTYRQYTDEQINPISLVFDETLVYSTNLGQNFEQGTDVPDESWIVGRPTSWPVEVNTYANSDPLRFFLTEVGVEALDIQENTEYSYSIYIGEVPVINGTVTTLSNFPNCPINPTPANEEIEVDWSDLTLSWEDGGGTESYNVYFWNGVDWEFLENTQDTTYVIPYTTETDENNVVHAYINETEMDWNVEFYWRVDAVNGNGTTEGDVWTFDARPAKVENLTPVNAATGIEMFPEYTWDVSTVADTYTLNVGIDELGGTYSIVVPGLTNPSYDSAVVNFQQGYIWGYNSSYHWRVDSVNGFGFAEGDEWTFGSIVFDSPTYWVGWDPDLEIEVPGYGEPEYALYWTFANKQILICAANNKIFYEI